MDPSEVTPIEPWRRMGCHRDPCAATADPTLFFASKTSRKIQSALLTGLEAGNGCIFLITGEAGIGKTMQLHALEAVLRVAGEAVMVHDGAGDPAPWVNRLTHSNRDMRGRSIIDLIDAAENCSAQTISQLIQALGTADGRGFQSRLVLASRPEIEGRVHGLVAAALAARINFNWLRLDRADPDDIEALLMHRLRRSGFSGMLPLSAPALRHIVNGSAGVPRRILELAALELDMAWLRAMMFGGYGDRSQPRRRTIRRTFAAVTPPLLAACAWLLLPSDVVNRAERKALEVVASGPWAISVRPSDVVSTGSAPTGLKRAPPQRSEIGIDNESARVVADAPMRLDPIPPLRVHDDADVAIVRVAHAPPATIAAAGTVNDAILVHRTTAAIAPPLRRDHVEPGVALGAGNVSVEMGPMIEETASPIVEPVFVPALVERVAAAIATITPDAPATETSPDLVAQASPPPPPRSSLGAEQISLLIRRGDEHMRGGDIAAARLFYDRAAAAGSVDAMRALARTYDPQELRRLGVIGLSADPERAQFWRQKADEAARAAPRAN